MDIPLISAISITQDTNINSTIECFKKQTYPNKELIIVNNSKNQLEASKFNIKAEKFVFIIDTPSKLTAGMARNYGVSAANGQIIAQFDTDTWHHPARLASQAAMLGESQLVLLSKYLSYSYVSGRVGFYRNPSDVVLNSMVYWRMKGVDFPNQEKHEEAIFVSRLMESGYKADILDNPELCCKIYRCGVDVRKPVYPVDFGYKKIIKSVIRDTSR